ncbi:hypothetical protein BDA99DRAFT_518180 [Phascolomyces articulosus]|uniref:NAD(P)-binding protein n=1 Tax=Phascolomyces articulosus TaxID=60185 RepID=A0AAD5JV36_9FUNG|nr:hypothetical protein BDA99DRAFT_518180 [Phascolomyces articulosus]
MSKATANDRVAQITAHLAAVGPSLRDKVCIVTGAGSPYGIGRATVYALARRGPKVIYATDLGVDDLQGLPEDVESKYPGVQVIIRAVNAAKTADVTAVIDDAVEKFGRLDVFFANAGIATGNMLQGEDEESFMTMMGINALSAFLACRYAGPAMQITGKGGKDRSGGSIICTASVAGIRSGAGSPEYSASKAAVINLCQTSSFQYAGTDVRVNAMCPGLIETGMTKPTFDYAREKGSAHKIGQLNPTRRYGVSAEIANVVAFLASDEASYVNGQAIAVDGGLSASHPVVPGRFH